METTKNLNIWLAMSVFLLAMGPAVAAEGTIYVDADASSGGDGLSWGTAYKYLQDALYKPPSGGDQIWVAQGIYKPDQGIGITPGDRTATFPLISGVTLKGGYASFNQSDPNARDIDKYKTILTGDLEGNDVDVNDPCDLWNEPSRVENSFHVVTGSSTDETAVLDGFTITGGNASECPWNPQLPDPNNVGGGIYIYSGRPTLTNCTLIGNSAWYGGGMYNYGLYVPTSPILNNCVFSGNIAGSSGGGMFSYGGGFFYWARPILSNCTFTCNSAPNGSALACDSGENRYSNDIQVTNCILWNDGNEIWNNDGSQITVSYSDVRGGENGVYDPCNGVIWGAGNIDADPCFVEPAYWDANGIWIDGDYHLLGTSPCINAGDPNYIAGPNETDLDGRPRIIGGRIDMGAYEYIPPIPAEVRIVPRTINLASKGKWITCYIWLPEDYNVADIDPNSVFLERKIAPQQFWLTEGEQAAIARFSREEVQGILDIGEVELSIIGWLTDRTLFEGRDVIRVINKEGGGKPDKYVQASEPNPPDGVIVVGINADLSWVSGPYVTSHDVYFGTSSLPLFVCNQTDTTFDPGTMADNTKYYWRIDEANKWGKTIGEVWSFTIMLSPPPPPPPPPPP